MVSFYRHNRTYTNVPVDHLAPGLATIGIPNLDGEFRFVFHRLWGSGIRRAYGFGLYFYTPTYVDPAARIAVLRLEIVAFISRNGAALSNHFNNSPNGSHRVLGRFDRTRLVKANPNSFRIENRLVIL